MKTKVWQVIWGLKDGGAETLAKDYARLADPQKFDISIVTMYPFTNTANYQRAKDAGIKVISIFGRRNILTRAVRVLLGRGYVPHRIKRILAKECPDAIHFNSPMAHYFISIKKCLKDIRLLYTCHNEVNKHFFSKEETAVRGLIRDNSLRLIALHEDMKKELDQRFACQNTVVVRNGVDLRVFREDKTDRYEVLHSINIQHDSYVVGHIGRFSEVKNHVFLLQVFQKIIEKRHNAHLLLIGDGELQQEIEQQIQRYHLDEHVTILSHRTDIPDLLHVMDVMVFPSFYEGLPVTLVEAQAAGLKCVVSDTINPASFLSEKIIPVSLHAPAEAWADITLDCMRKNQSYGCLDDYDIYSTIRQLEGLYLDKLDVEN